MLHTYIGCRITEPVSFQAPTLHWKGPKTSTRKNGNDSSYVTGHWPRATNREPAEPVPRYVCFFNHTRTATEVYALSELRRRAVPQSCRGVHVHVHVQVVRVQGWKTGVQREGSDFAD